VVRLSVEADTLLLQYNHQPRPEPDRTVGDWDWSVFEERYHDLLPPERSVRSYVRSGVGAVRVPLLTQSANADNVDAYG
jgi:hypothetical protein